MSGAIGNKDILCKDRFSTDQVRRMRTYIEYSSLLPDFRVPDATQSGNLPAGIYGNITVATGTSLDVDSNIEMLPGAFIRVQPGGQLNVRAVITGACGQMWRGIIVEGDAFSPQTTQYQGRIEVHSTGKIEHALCAIEVQDVDVNGNSVPGTGGGIIKVTGGAFVDNSVGVRFGQYAGGVNKSRFLLPSFEITDNYRGGSVQPLHMDLRGVVRMRVEFGDFVDNRTQCAGPSSLAMGIDLKNAGLIANSCDFENLEVGVRANELLVSTGSFEVQGGSFTKCYTGIHSLSTSSFAIKDSYFTIEKPDACPASSLDITGVQLEGNTTGFTFLDNDFSFNNGLALPNERLIGIHSMGTGTGLNNTIRKNKFTNLFIGNLAEGLNGADEGLLYLCNTNVFADGFSTNPIPFDYQVEEGGTVKSVQGERIDLTTILPTGNAFADFGYTFHNSDQNGVIDYYYNDTNPNEDPDIGVGSEGIVNFFINQPNSNCTSTDPCPPPCTISNEVNRWKQNFYDGKQEWQSRIANLPNITDSLLLEAEKDTILWLRLAMNKNGSRILRQYSLDTNQVETDSLLTWLGQIETFPTDLRLTRHYFFSGDFTNFDNLWPQLPTKYRLSGHELDEHTELTLVYELVRPHLEAGGELEALQQGTLDSLQFWATWCTEPGFLAQCLLWWNGIRAAPDCSSVQTRSAVPEETEESLPEHTFQVFPNPADRTLTVLTGERFKKWEVRLYDMNGRQLLSRDLHKGATKTTIEIAGFTPGMYVLEVHIEHTAVYHKKIVISR